MKNSIGIFCKDLELYLSLKRALPKYFDNTQDAYLFDINLFLEKQFNVVGDTDLQKMGTLKALPKNKLNKKIDTVTKTRLIQQLHECSLVIVVSFEIDSLQIIYLIHRLRSDLLWQGRFLAIVSDNSEKEYLMEADIFGEKEGRFQFGKIPGHDVIYPPFLIKDLKQKIDMMEEMCANAWRNNIIEGSIIKSIEKKVNEAEALIKKHDAEKEVIDLVYKILSDMNQINWDMLVGHYNAKLIEENIIKKYNQSVRLKLKDCHAILKEYKKYCQIHNWRIL